MMKSKPARGWNVVVAVWGGLVIVGGVLGLLALAAWLRPDAKDVFEVRVTQCKSIFAGAAMEVEVTNKTDRDQIARIEVEYRDLYGRLLAEDSFRVETGPRDRVLRQEGELFGNAEATRECVPANVRVVS